MTRGCRRAGRERSNRFARPVRCPTTRPAPASPLSPGRAGGQRRDTWWAPKSDPRQSRRWQVSFDHRNNVAADNVEVFGLDDVGNREEEMIDAAILVFTDALHAALRGSGDQTRLDSGMDANSARIRASCSADWVGASSTVTDIRRVSGSRPMDSQAWVRSPALGRLLR